MLKCFEDFRPYLHLFSDDCAVDRDVPKDVGADDMRRLPLVDLIPSVAEQRKIAALLDEMTAFEVITNKLQSNDITLATIRDIFDVVIEEYDSMDKQAGEETALLRSERNALRHLISTYQPQLQSTTTSPGSKSKRKRAAEALNEKINKESRKRKGPESKFIDVKWIPATSVVVERIFSSVKTTVGYLRKRMSHETLEVIMFLKLNWDLVTLADVSKTIENAKDSNSVADE
ncbi:unnamed protein product [Phytophthora lilii]|uniref:Unnamed protein product n=1 Tax=Phytophthora lilii TaxID=2077276 RepID=A0A9W6UBX0_9STRA|nr:unnamed protein product [Phytophthora lilii]